MNSVRFIELHNMMTQYNTINNHLNFINKKLGYDDSIQEYEKSLPIIENDEDADINVESFFIDADDNKSNEI